MPITPREWKEELEPKDTELLAKFETKPYQAYALEELLPQTPNIILGIASAFVLKGQLDRLVEKGLLQAKPVAGKMQYISTKAI